MKRRGLVLGKFMPLHKGHCHLIDFAASQVDELMIVVGTMASEPISGKLRFDWVQSLYPQHCVLHLAKKLPQQPSEHPDFWNLWEAALKHILPYPVDFIFASENYGHKLAQVLGAEFIVCDIERNTVPISGTSIRQNPHAYWLYLPEQVKAYYTKRICIFGPESCGKTTLAESLAKSFNTVWVPEAARQYLEERNGLLNEADLLNIAKLQVKQEQQAMRQGHKLLISDTDPLLTCVWSDFLYFKVDKELLQLARKSRYDLTLLLYPDIPWVEDIVRYTPDSREQFYDMCKYYLKHFERKYIEIKGNKAQRNTVARASVQSILQTV